MKNIKETIIGVFAVIGFVAIVSGFTTNNAVQEPNYGTPESHVWELQVSSGSNPIAFSINKVTGEVRKFNSAMDRATKDPDYVVMKEFKSDKY